jgi:hypothetical protein
MSAEIIPVLRKRRWAWPERHPEWRTAFLLAALVLFVIAAALPAEDGRQHGNPVTPCHLIVAKDPLLKAIAPLK